MLRNTLMFAAAATAFLAAPSLAQDAPAQTPPASAPATATTPPAPSGTLQLQPGASVRGSDGSVIGTLEGVRNNDAGEQELTVRGSDGQLRGVPLAGLTQQGADVVVGWSVTEYQAAPAIQSAAPTPPTTPPAPDGMSTADPAATPPSSDGAEEDEPTDPQS